MASKKTKRAFLVTSSSTLHPYLLPIHMSHPYDVVSKDYLEVDPSVWPALLGRPCPPGSVRVGDSDLSTVSTATDKVLLIDEPEPWGLLMEFQASHDPNLPTATLQRYGIVRHKYGIPFSVGIIFLRREANMPIFRAKGLAQTNPLNPGKTWYFPCQFIRLWELPVEDFLKGPLALLPFAPLTNVSESEVPGIIETIKKRARTEAVPDLGKKLLAATYVLMGLRYDEEWTQKLFEGVSEMEESSTYQGLIRKGKEMGKRETMRETIRRWAEKRLGPIPPELNAHLEMLTDLDHLRRMEDSAPTATSWEELFSISPA